jgi:2-phospho-L-lactate guanylyltransferase
MKVSALIPIKGFRNAKQRLSSVLGPGEREMLAAVMFRDVLRQALKTHGLAETFVVTGDDQAAEIAKTLGAKVIREKSENGETDAVDFARVELKRMGREAVLILPADMPLIRSGDIEQLLAHVPEGATPPFALLVPSHDHLGTNALLLAPADLIKLRFGYDSFSYHMSQVAAHGLPLRFIENERIALDIDEPRDLERFLSVEIADGESACVARGLLADQAAEKSHSSGGL